MIYPFVKEYKLSTLSLKRACLELSVSRSGYFKYLKKKQVQKVKIEKAVKEAFQLHKGLYGYRKLFHYLRQKRGMFVCLSQVRLILKKKGLRAKTVRGFKPQTTQSGSNKSVSERVFRVGESLVTGLDQVWVSDITYLRAKGGGFFYLSLFLDVYSRRIIGWEVSCRLSATGVLTALYRAVKARSVVSGVIVHSDRGVQYSCAGFRSELKRLGFIQSMSRRGNCYDNSHCESVFSLLKRELGFRVYSSLEEARGEIFEWIEGWYNTERLHSSLGYRSPVEFEKMMKLTHGIHLNRSPLF